MNRFIRSSTTRIGPLRNHAFRRLALFGAVAALATLSACSDASPTAPVSTLDPQVKNSLLSNLLTPTATIGKTALLRTTPLATPVSQSFTVTAANGGSLAIPSLGFTITVPKGAINVSSLTITVHALAGRAVAYEFSPEGTQFLRPVRMRQSLDNTTWSANQGWAILGAGYFKSATQINAQTGAALVDETIPALLTSNNVFWNASHFSGYMVSMD